MEHPKTRARDLPTFPSATVEIWVARKLGLPGIFQGSTTGESRRERVRARILELDPTGAIVAGTRNGKAETWRELFQRIYGEPLIRTTTTNGDTDGEEEAPEPAQAPVQDWAVDQHAHGEARG